MKPTLFTRSLFCALFAAATCFPAVAGGPAAAAPPAATASATQTAALLRAFYTDYCTLIAGSSNSAAEQQLLDSCLTAHARRKMRGLDHDPLIQAQDFDMKSVATIAATHIDGEWYAVAYLDTYRNACVIIPVKASLQEGRLKISDFAIR